MNEQVTSGPNGSTVQGTATVRPGREQETAKVKVTVNGSWIAATERLRTIGELAMMGQTAKLDEMQVRGGYDAGRWVGFDYRDQVWVEVEAG